MWILANYVEDTSGTQLFLTVESSNHFIPTTAATTIETVND